MATAVMFGADGSKELEALAAFAARPENLYRLAPGSVSPGDRPEFVRVFRCTVLNPNIGPLEQELRVVFSLTEMADGKRYRHASFSLIHEVSHSHLRTTMRVAPGLTLRGEGMPAPSAVEAACLVLGYTGRLPNWIVDIHEHDGPRPVIAVAQELPGRGRDA